VTAVVWLLVALVTWPVLALAAGLILGRCIAAAGARQPRLGSEIWLRRELPRDIVSPVPDLVPHPVPPYREPTPI
jgi:hypothetical protein